jgi:hypothetical protein
MLNAVLATIAMLLWLGSYGLFFARDLRRWARERPYRRLVNEMERLEAVRAYAAWVRNMPPAPVRPRSASGASVVPTPVLPPVRGAVRAYPGRRLLGN